MNSRRVSKSGVWGLVDFSMGPREDRFTDDNEELTMAVRSIVPVDFRVDRVGEM